MVGVLHTTLCSPRASSVFRARRSSERSPMSFEPLSTLKDKVAVIAGGTGAIGHAAAHRLARLGARVVLLHRGDRAHAQSLANALPGERHGEVVASITDSPALKAAARDVVERFGRVDILVNSAGFTKVVPAHDLETLTDELIDTVLAANFRGVIATVRAFLPPLKASGDGLIVNVSSIAGFTGVGSNLAYVAAKAGIDVVGDALARALAPEVRVL